MTPLVSLDPYLIQWIKEWLKHQKLKEEIENLGIPKFELPQGPQPWNVPLSELIGSMNQETLKKIASLQIDQQIRMIDKQIEELDHIKSQYQEMLNVIQK